MTEEQKIVIQKMRADKKTYKEIAIALGLSQNTVKSYYLRHRIGNAPGLGYKIWMIIMMTCTVII